MATVHGQVEDLIDGYERLATCMPTMASRVTDMHSRTEDMAFHLQDRMKHLIDGYEYLDSLSSMVPQELRESATAHRQMMANSSQIFSPAEKENLCSQEKELANLKAELSSISYERMVVDIMSRPLLRPRVKLQTSFRSGYGQAGITRESAKPRFIGDTSRRPSNSNGVNGSNIVVASSNLEDNITIPEYVPLSAMSTAPKDSAKDATQKPTMSTSHRSAPPVPVTVPTLAQSDDKKSNRGPRTGQRSVTALRQKLGKTDAELAALKKKLLASAAKHERERSLCKQQLDDAVNTISSTWRDRDCQVTVNMEKLLSEAVHKIDHSTAVNTEIRNQHKTAEEVWAEKLSSYRVLSVSQSRPVEQSSNDASESNNRNNDNNNETSVDRDDEDDDLDSRPTRNQATSPTSAENRPHVTILRYEDLAKGISTDPRSHGRHPLEDSRGFDTPDLRQRPHINESLMTASKPHGKPSSLSLGSQTGAGSSAATRQHTSPSAALGKSVTFQLQGDHSTPRALDMLSSRDKEPVITDNSNVHSGQAHAHSADHTRNFITSEHVPLTALQQRYMTVLGPHTLGNLVTGVGGVLGGGELMTFHRPFDSISAPSVDINEKKMMMMHSSRDISVTSPRLVCNDTADREYMTSLGGRGTADEVVQHTSVWHRPTDSFTGLSRVMAVDASIVQPNESKVASDEMSDIAEGEVEGAAVVEDAPTPAPQEVSRPKGIEVDLVALLQTVVQSQAQTMQGNQALLLSMIQNQHMHQHQSQEPEDSDDSVHENDEDDGAESATSLLQKEVDNPADVLLASAPDHNDVSMCADVAAKVLSPHLSLHTPSSSPRSAQLVRRSGDATGTSPRLCLSQRIKNSSTSGPSAADIAVQLAGAIKDIVSTTAQEIILLNNSNHHQQQQQHEAPQPQPVVVQLNMPPQPTQPVAPALATVTPAEVAAAVSEGVRDGVRKALELAVLAVPTTHHNQLSSNTKRNPAQTDARNWAPYASPVAASDGLLQLTSMRAHSAQAEREILREAAHSRARATALQSHTTQLNCSISSMSDNDVQNGRIASRVELFRSEAELIVMGARGVTAARSAPAKTLPHVKHNDNIDENWHDDDEDEYENNEGDDVRAAVHADTLCNIKPSRNINTRNSKPIGSRTANTTGTGYHAVNSLLARRQCVPLVSQVANHTATEAVLHCDDMSWSSALQSGSQDMDFDHSDADLSVSYDAHCGEHEQWYRSGSCLSRKHREKELSRCSSDNSLYNSDSDSDSYHHRTRADRPGKDINNNTHKDHGNHQDNHNDKDHGSSSSVTDSHHSAASLDNSMPSSQLSQSMSSSSSTLSSSSSSAGSHASSAEKYRHLGNKLALKLVKRNELIKSRAPANTSSVEDSSATTERPHISQYTSKLRLWRPT